MKPFGCVRLSLILLCSLFIGECVTFELSFVASFINMCHKYSEFKYGVNPVAPPFPNLPQIPYPPLPEVAQPPPNQATDPIQILLGTLMGEIFRGKRLATHELDALSRRRSADEHPDEDASASLSKRGIKDFPDPLGLESGVPESELDCAASLSGCTGPQPKLPAYGAGRGLPGQEYPAGLADVLFSAESFSQLDELCNKVKYPGIAVSECEVMNVLTYNVGLISFMPDFASRQTRMPEAIATQLADVVCLQEVIYQSDMLRILHRVANKYPYSYSFLHETTSTRKELHRLNTSESRSHCSQIEWLNVVQCMQSSCPTQTMCLICAQVVFSLPQDCMTCLVNNFANFYNAEDPCVYGWGEFANFNPNGLLLLSKTMLDEPGRQEFFEGIKKVALRGVIDATVSGLGKVACTHLLGDVSQINGQVPYFEGEIQNKTGISSFQEHNAWEINILLERYKNEERLVIAGDFNTGPEIEAAQIRGEFLPNYETLITKGGFSNPFVTQNTKCTFCADNSISFYHNVAIDHVLLRGCEAQSSVRMFDEASPPLSDHYGVQVGICKL